MVQQLRTNKARGQQSEDAVALICECKYWLDVEGAKMDWKKVLMYGSFAAGAILFLTGRRPVGLAVAEWEWPRWHLSTRRSLRRSGTIFPSTSRRAANSWTWQRRFWNASASARVAVFITFLWPAAAATDPFWPARPESCFIQLRKNCS